MPGCSSVENIGFASDARGSSSTSWRNVWYGPQDTPVPSNAARTSSSERASNHGRRTAAIRSRAPKRPSSEETSWPVTPSRLLERLGGPGDIDQRGPLAAGERDDHHAAAVAGAEVVAEGAVEVVAVARGVLAADLHLGDPPEVADHRERDVGEREPDQLALAGARAVALGGEDPGRGEPAHDRVPRRQHRVERAGEVARAGRPREAGRRVDGVVDLRGAVRVAGQRAHDQVGAALAQRVVGEPAAGGEVRQEDPAAGPARPRARRRARAPRASAGRPGSSACPCSGRPRTATRPTARAASG